MNPSYLAVSDSRVVKKARIIGGMFGLELGGTEAVSCSSKPPILSGNHLRLATARSALLLVESHLRPSSIWMPSYLCEAMVIPFRSSPTRIRFYEIGEHLEIRDDTWVLDVQSGDVVVFIDYFGLRTWTDIAPDVKAKGAFIVEDASQALLSVSFYSQADYVIASPRKFVGVPDGGILLSQNGSDIPPLRLSPPPSCWHLESMRAAQGRKEFDQYGADTNWFETFKRAEATAPSSPYKMSELSSYILDEVLDFQRISKIRRENFLFLAAALGEFAVFPTLPESVVPLGFPIALKERERIRQGLFRARIFPPVHWNLQGVVPENFSASHRLSARMMTLPCDHRCSRDDMNYLIETFKSLLPRTA